jgi:PST family polysaccharide transporter
MKEIKTKNKSQKRLLIENIASLSLLQWVNYLVPLLLIPFLVRSLGIEVFGLVMFAQSVSTIFIIFSDLGFSITGTRKISILTDDKKQISEIFWDITTIKVATLILLFGVLLILIAFVPKFSKEPLLFIFSYGVTIGSTIFPSWFFQGIQKMKIITVVNATAKLIFALLVVIYVTSPEDYLLVPLFNSSGFIIAGFSGLIYATRHVTFLIPKLKNIKAQIKESAPVLLSSISITLYTSSNVLILGFLTNNTITGVYASFEKVILALKGVYSPIYQAMFPWLSMKKDINKCIRKTEIYVFIIGLIGSFFLIVFSRQILEIVFNDELIISYNKGFQLISTVLLLAGMNMLYNFLFLSAKKEYILRMKILGTTSLIGLLLSITLTASYGIYGTIIAVVSTELILLIWGYLTYKKLTL